MIVHVVNSLEKVIWTGAQYVAYADPYVTFFASGEAAAPKEGRHQIQPAVNQKQLLITASRSCALHWPAGANSPQNIWAAVWAAIKMF